MALRYIIFWGFMGFLFWLALQPAKSQVREPKWIEKLEPSEQSQFNSIKKKEE